MILPLLLIILVSNSVFMLYLIKKIYINIRRSEKSQLELIKYKYLETDLKAYRQHRHDMTNHLTVIYELVKAGKYKDLEDYTKDYMSKTHKKLKSLESGSDEVDVLLHHKIHDARHSNISVDYNVQPVFDISHYALTDVVSIFSNLLDNAIEANMAIKDQSQRALNITINQDPLDYIVVVTNTFLPTKAIDRFSLDGYTTKEDKKNHGLGMGIISKIVDKYQGHMKIEVLNNVFFQVKIELPKLNLK